MAKLIDLFAGCGGFSCGFQKAGYEITTALEIDKTIAECYSRNHKSTRVIADDIRNIDNSGIFTDGCADVIIGGPPCQGFSMAGARIRKNARTDDPRNYLFMHYFNIVKIVRPKVFVIENVKGIQTLDGGRVFNEILRMFSEPDNFGGTPYNVHFKLMCAKDFGIPQARERMIIIGAQNDFDFDRLLADARCKISLQHPDYFEPVSVWQAISDLPAPSADGNVSNLICQSSYQQFLANYGKTFNHVKSNHSKLAVERMKQIAIDENFTVLEEEIRSVHSGSYGRLNPNGIAPTVTTRFDTPSGGKFIHPFENRTITPREAARIQSFPDSFEFTGNKTSICKQIGNAVPPKLSYVVARMVEELL